MRRYPFNHIVRRQQRYENAMARQEKRQQINARQQLAELDQRLGVGVGAMRERQRLAREL